MLVVIDPQNTHLKPEGEQYVSGGKAFVTQLRNRIQQARATGEFILYTRDIPIEDQQNSERWQLQVVSELQAELKEAVELTKHFYALPPDRLLELRHEKVGHKWWAVIEVCGLETHLCVLANLLGLQSVFPEANFVVDTQYLLSSDQKRAHQTLALLPAFGVEVKNFKEEI